MKTKLFTLLLAIVASIGTMFAWDYNHLKIGDLYYNLNKADNTAQVTSQSFSIPRWIDAITDADIPTSVTHNSVPYDVTSVEKVAFEDCLTLTSVIIPNSVRSIGESAFRGCTALTYIKIGYLVDTIKHATFYECTGLTSINIPVSIDCIESQAFAHCSSATSVNTGNGVKSIGDYAFQQCTSMTSLTIGNSVTSIGKYAFYKCYGLTSITIPKSVKSIGSYAFKDCTGLTSITCKSINPPSLGMGIFNGVDNTIPLFVPDQSVEAYKAADGWNYFKDNTYPISSTAIHQTTIDQSQTTNRKLIIDGQLFIQRGDELFNASGARVECPVSRHR